MITVCLDPGHGGYDPGAVGNGLQEKDLTLDICLNLKPLLEFNGINVALTRDGDYAPGHITGDQVKDLWNRVRIAESAKADLFASVHINANVAVNVGTGTEVIVAGKGGRAETAAEKILPYLVRAGSWANRGVKVQNVMVLRETSVPAILTESGFINTVADADKLRDPSFRKALAVAHAKGICDYFGIQYHTKGGFDVLEHAVVYFTDRDFSSARMVSDRLGGCAMFCRNGTEAIHAEAKSAKHLVVIGGPVCTDHGNVINCCGVGAPETAIAGAKYVQSL